MPYDISAQSGSRAIIAASRAVGWLARRFLGQPQMVGEMIAGVLLGPSLLGRLAPGLEAALFPADAIGDAGAWIVVALELPSLGQGSGRRLPAKHGDATMNTGACGPKVPVNIGLADGIIRPALFATLVLMAILTTLMASPLFMLTQRRVQEGASA